MKKREFALEMEKACGRFETEYSIEVQELLVLTGEFVGGGIRYERDVWEHGVGFLASVDLAGGEALVLTVHNCLPSFLFCAGRRRLMLEKVRVQFFCY